MVDVVDLFKAVGKVGVTVDSRAVTKLIPQTPRRRAAVVVHDGFAAMELYHAVRPKLFYGSLITAVGATGMAWWRRRQGTEAITSWSLLAGVAGVLAYVTRPGAGVGTAEGANASNAQQRAFAWLDARAANLDRTSPGWEDKTIARMVG